MDIPDLVKYVSKTKNIAKVMVLGAVASSGMKNPTMSILQNEVLMVIYVVKGPVADKTCSTVSKRDLSWCKSCIVTMWYTFSCVKETAGVHQGKPYQHLGKICDLSNWQI